MTLSELLGLKCGYSKTCLDYEKGSELCNGRAYNNCETYKKQEEQKKKHPPKGALPVGF